jgi:hypothetical protein
VEQVQLHLAVFLQAMVNLIVHYFISCDSKRATGTTRAKDGVLV